jgi:hypothetical protein
LALDGMFKSGQNVFFYSFNVRDERQAKSREAAF